jgi:2,3-bisphosphoglycerate-dependent phosphoglycerate mutase
MMTNDHTRLQRRPFLAPIWLFSVTMAAALVGVMVLLSIGWLWYTANSTVIVVVRHAEKVQEGTDPALSPEGEARAALLARMFGEARLPGHIDAIYTSPALRNRMTAAPLAARLRLTPTVAAADDSTALARRILREHSGGRILVVGHSDTVPELVAALSGERDIPEIGAMEYGTLYIVTVPRIGHANFVRLSY